MKHALGIDPVHRQTITKPEMCGSCHTVHLPILHRGKTIGHAYEQTTYPEWAFSDFRTGDSVDGPLPYGSGPQAQSCQGCHMPNKDVFGNPYRSKIAAIQEYTNFPQAEHTLPPEDIDLQERSGFGKHTLVGLNVYLLKMAWQFPDILGIRKTDPMLSRQRHRLDPDRRERDARSGGQPHRRGDRRRRAQRRTRCSRARHRDQQGRAQVSVGRRLPPRLPAVQRARREQQGAVVVGAHQRRSA